MKLRNRLFISSSAPLLVLGAIIAGGYVWFRTTVMPDLKAHLEHKAESGAAVLGAQLDLALGAEDPAMVAEAIADELRDRDIAYVAVEDANGATVFRHGAAADPAFPPVAPRTPHAAGGTVMAWAPVSLEGVHLGRVQIRFSTDRIDHVDRWGQRLALLILLVWIGALVYGLRFSRQFVAPLRTMMNFSRTVAGGRFDQRLTSGAGGELGELELHLNQMAHGLESQEAERFRAAARVDAMQRELLGVTRMAGMAEIATGVLHNVGNVLNSLNTSVSTVSGKLRASKVASLAKGLDLYRDHPGGLRAFLDTDRGKLLPPYLEKVAAQLGAENAEALAELESINRNVQHIATIVSTQQAYTRVSAVREPVDVAALCDDALHMVEGSIQRHGITLVKDYRSVPTVVTDRHKVLQIIINLLSNARHALDDGPAGEKRMRVELAAEDGELTIRIADSGVGIPPENLERIFQHGFTTKKTGHGFGLHSAANAAAELGGRLTADSAGPGLGAAFTLALPLDATEQHDDGG